VIVATMFAGIAVIRGWFHVFGGPVTPDAPQHVILPRERVALSILLAILIGLGVYPGPFVTSLEHVAASLLAVREHHLPGQSPEGVHP
jgi:formate hydrogenlyase subunit 3/multisubunit Na+/H+ antiporter MnhD subunit